MGDKLHIVSDNISFFIIEHIVLQTLVSSDTHWISRFAHNFVDWSCAGFLILVKGFLEFFVQLVDFWLDFVDWNHVLFKVGPVLFETLLGKQHDEDWFVFTFNESDDGQWRVEVKEVEDKDFDDEGIIVVLLVLMVLIVAYLGS